MKLKRYISLAVLAFIFLTIIPPPSFTYAMDPSNFNRKVEIQIQESKIDSTLTNFPVLLTEDTVPTEVCDADGDFPAQNGGGDVRFTSDEAGTTQLPLEIVTFVTDDNPANCNIEMWVKVPSVSSSVNTSIWMWYNTDTTDSQPSPSDTYGSENVWDGNYGAVWHMNNNPGGTAPQIQDSTTNSNSGTTIGSMTGGDLVSNAGVGLGLDMDSVDDYISVGDGGSTMEDTTFTIEAWIKGRQLDAGNGWKYILTRWDSVGTATTENYGFGTDPANRKLRLEFHAPADEYKTALSNTSLSEDVLYHVAVTYDGTTARFYLNGTPDGNTTISATPMTVGDLTLIGARIDHTSPPDVRLGWDGTLDEIRFSDGTARSAAWIKASYLNQSDPSTFAVDQSPAVLESALNSVRKGSDQNVTSSTTLANDSHLSLAVEANKSYVVNGVIFATSTSAAPDIKFAFNAPTGSTLNIGHMSVNTDGQVGLQAGLLESSGAVSDRIAIRANTPVIIQFFGTVEVGSSSGSLLLQWAQQDSSATATTVKEGSYISVSEAADE